MNNELEKLAKDIANELVTEKKKGGDWDGFEKRMQELAGRMRKLKKL